MKAITVQNPWAHLLALGVKPVENRRQGSSYRGPLAIHAGLRFDDGGLYDLDVVGALGYVRRDPASELAATFRAQAGCIIAVADLVDVHIAVPRCCAPWGWQVETSLPSTVRLDAAPRTFRHLVLADVRRLAEPVPVRGALGLWTVPADLEPALAPP